MSATTIKPIYQNPLAVASTAAAHEDNLRKQAKLRKHHHQAELAKEQLQKAQAEELAELAHLEDPFLEDEFDLAKFIAKSSSGTSNLTTTSKHALSASALQAKFNSRLLNPDEIKVITEYYQESLLDDKDVKNLEAQLEECEEGQELHSLNGFFASKQLSVAQQYLLLIKLYQNLSKRNKKEKFTDQLKAYVGLFEQQNSSYLFEFFALIGNQKVTKQFSPDAVDALATINSAALNISDLKTTINVIEQVSGEDFGSIVALYMQSRTHQLKALKKYTGSEDDKAKLFELITFERNLLHINSLYGLQTEFIKKKS